MLRKGGARSGDITKSGKPAPNKRSNGHDAGAVILASGYSADELSFVSKGDTGSNNIGTPRKHKKPKRAGAQAPELRVAADEGSFGNGSPMVLTPMVTSDNSPVSTPGRLKTPLPDDGVPVDNRIGDILRQTQYAVHGKGTAADEPDDAFEPQMRV